MEDVPRRAHRHYRHKSRRNPVDDEVDGVSAPHRQYHHHHPSPKDDEFGHHSSRGGYSRHYPNRKHAAPPVDEFDPFPYFESNDGMLFFCLVFNFSRWIVL